MSDREQRPPLGRRDFLRRGLAGAASLGAAGLALRCAPAAAEDEVLLEEAKSEFNLVQVTQKGPIRTMYFVVNGIRYIESRWDMDHPRSLDLDYARTMMAGFLLHPAPRRIMMMGLGGGNLATYLFQRFPDLEVDAVDIDPEVVRLAHKYFGVPDDPRYRTHVADGRLFIEKATQPWDMLILDAFRGVFVPYHLKTQEFYGACLKAMTPDAVVVANLHNLTSMYPHDRATLASVFPQRYTFISEKRNQTTFVASASERRVGVYEMRENAAEIRDKFDFDLDGLAARYYLRRDWDPRSKVLTDDFDPKELEKAVDRHNETCVHDCQYPAR